MTSTTMGSRPHALVLPIPGQGHINPMLAFSLQLAVHGGFIITFVNTDKAHKRMLEANKQLSQQLLDSTGSEGVEIDFRFASIPHGSEGPLPGQEAPKKDDQQGKGTFQVQLSYMCAVLDGIASHQGLLEDMVVNSRATPHPITCLISDSFFPWAQAMANKLGIKNASVWTSSAVMLATSMEMCSGTPSAVDDAPIREVTAGLPNIPSSEFLSQSPFRDPERVKWMKNVMRPLPEAACVVVNTFQELEEHSLQAAAAASGCHIRIHSVGPLFPPSTVSIKGASLIPEQSSTCVDWLDQQAPGSVLYVSFGSVVSLSSQELEELALGIELSKQPFLWVARDSADLLPEGFVDRTRGHGLVVNWAPQVQVLGHAAVGGFLTHCGWNSILESIHAGVPTLCYPVYADQFFNALLITKRWGIGIGMRKDEHLELFTRSEVQTALAALMNSEELHSKVATWKAAARRAVAPGGSSFASLEGVIRDVGGTVLADS